MTPAVSVVVPTYNRSGSVRGLLVALDDQVGVPGEIEVVVVDDGSVDDTAAVVEAHGGVRLLRQANRGPGAARNAGWRSATAAVVAFTDDDTLPSPTWLAELLQALDGRELDAVGGAVVSARASPVTRFVELDRLVNHALDDDGSVRFLITANLAVRVAVLDAVGGFDERFRTASGEDVDLTFRLAAAGARMGVIDGAVVRHEHPTAWRDVFALFAKHGAARRDLLARHPGESLGRPSQWRRVAPGRLVRRYRSAGVGPVRTVQYLGAHYAGLAVLAWSARRARS